MMTATPDATSQTNSPAGIVVSDACSVATHVLHPDWRNDELPIDPEEVGIYPASDADPDNNEYALPIRFNGKTMAELRKAVIGLAEKGAPCWPGEIMPLVMGEQYGVWIKDKWVAIVGIPTQNMEASRDEGGAKS